MGSKTNILKSFWENIKTILQALAMALVLRTFLFQPFSIPTGSLIPTLLVGDYLFVSKYAYGYSKYSFPLNLGFFSERVLSSTPQRGDVAVFKLPSDKSIDYIKRVIGLPGDKIQMIAGRLYINDTLVERTYERTDTLSQEEQENKVLVYKETLPNGVSHFIQETQGDTGDSDNTPPYIVPEGNYFMMGDNRDNSLDSRFLSKVGYIPFDHFVGRAEIVFFSIGGGYSAWHIWSWPFNVRWDRLLMRIK